LGLCTHHLIWVPCTRYLIWFKFTVNTRYFISVYTPFIYFLFGPTRPQWLFSLHTLSPTWFYHWYSPFVLVYTPSLPLSFYHSLFCLGSSLPPIILSEATHLILCPKLHTHHSCKCTQLPSAWLCILSFCVGLRTGSLVCEPTIFAWFVVLRTPVVFGSPFIHTCDSLSDYM
jgi:hypothetical protein